VKILWCQH